MRLICHRASQLYNNISTLFLFPVKDGRPKLSTGVKISRVWLHSDVSSAVYAGQEAVKVSMETAFPRGKKSEMLFQSHACVPMASNLYDTTLKCFSRSPTCEKPLDRQT